MNNWAAVMALREGTYVKVDVVGATPAYGPLASADPLAIILRSGFSLWTIPVSRVREVRVLRDTATRDSLRGLILGGVAGGLVGALIGRHHKVRWGGALATYCGLQGAYVGGSAGMRNRHEVVVFVRQEGDGLRDPLHNSVMAGTHR
jgi:uncharacterized protein YcfJ